MAGDAAFYSAKNETAAHDRGVKRVCIPSRSTKSADRKREQKKRWFRQGQKWRTGCEGRISVLKRRHGLRRCLYRGDAGMKRWVGLGVIADNLTHIGTVLAERKKLNFRSLLQSTTSMPGAPTAGHFRRLSNRWLRSVFREKPNFAPKVASNLDGSFRGIAHSAGNRPDLDARPILPRCSAYSVPRTRKRSLTPTVKRW